MIFRHLPEAETEIEEALAYPYDLVYRLGAHEIVVVALAHQSRRPGYWRERLSEKNPDAVESSRPGDARYINIGAVMESVSIRARSDGRAMSSAIAFTA